jgi:hypothetical protein
LATALLLRSEWYEAELAQRLLSYEQAGADGKERQFRRELQASVRYHSSEAWTTGLRVTRNPLPACCLAPATSRFTYALSAEIQGDELKNEIVYTYGPAYHADGVDDIKRHGLSCAAFYPVSPAWTLQGSLQAERGEDKGSQVAIATASGTEKQADVEAFAWSVGFGTTLNL